MVVIRDASIIKKRGNFSTMSQKGGGTQKCLKFKFGHYKPQGGSVNFPKMSELQVTLRPQPNNVKIKHLICPFSMYICLNKMSVRGGGGLPPSICSQIQKCLKLIQEGGPHLSNKSEIQKKSEISDRGEGGKPIWDIVSNFPVF